MPATTAAPHGGADLAVSGAHRRPAVRRAGTGRALGPGVRAVAPRRALAGTVERRHGRIREHDRHLQKDAEGTGTGR
jgi:hypothetical protein